MNYLAALKGSQQPAAALFVIPEKSPVNSSVLRHEIKPLPDIGKIKIEQVRDRNKKLIGSREEDLNRKKVIPYNQKITLAARTRDHLKAQKIFDQIILGGHTPDSYSWTSLIKAYCNSNMENMAFEKFRLMASNTPPNEVTYNILITFYVKKR